MHFTTLLVSSLAASTAAATVGLGHSGKMHNHAHRHVEIMRNQEYVVDACVIEGFQTDRRQET